MDTLGRFLAGKYLLSPKVTVILAVIRTAFVFTTLFTATHADPGEIFRADWFRLINLFLFSLSNGYVSTNAIILGPSLVKEKEQQQQASMFGALFLCLGITIGSIINIPVNLIYHNVPK